MISWFLRIFGDTEKIEKLEGILKLTSKLITDLNDGKVDYDLIRDIERRIDAYFGT